ncbi:MAG: hypothetical protein ACRERU_00670 [Methylococcales bacterium]
MSEDLVIEILCKIQNDLASVKHRIEQVDSSMNLQFTALNGKLSGQLISEIEFREQVNDLKQRVDRIERRLELSDD